MKSGDLNRMIYTLRYNPEKICIADFMVSNITFCKLIRVWLSVYVHLELLFTWVGYSYVLMNGFGIYDGKRYSFQGNVHKLMRINRRLSLCEVNMNYRKKCKDWA